MPGLRGQTTDKLVVLNTTTKKGARQKGAVYRSPPLYADELSTCF